MSRPNKGTYFEVVSTKEHMMSVSSCINHRLKLAYKKRREIESLRETTSMCDLSPSNIPSLEDTSVWDELLKDITSGVNPGGIFSGIKRNRDGYKEQSDRGGGKKRSSMSNGRTINSGKISPVKLLEDLFLALSVISIEFQPMTDDQADMVMREVRTLIPRLFGESMLEYFDYLKATFALTSPSDIKKDAVIVARRRGGKSYTLTAVVACVMAILPQQMILFFSTGERISTLGRDTIIDMLEILINSSTTKKFSKIKYMTSGEQLLVLNYRGQINRADFLPSNPEVSITTYFYRFTIMTLIINTHLPLSKKKCYTH